MPLILKIDSIYTPYYPYDIPPVEFTVFLEDEKLLVVCAREAQVKRTTKTLQRLKENLELLCPVIDILGWWEIGNRLDILDNYDYVYVLDPHRISDKSIKRAWEKLSQDA